MLQYPTIELTRDQKDALQGTSGDPSDTNRYVTQQEPKLSLATQTTDGILSAADKKRLDDFTNPLGEPASLNTLAKFQIINLFRSLFDANSELLLMDNIIPNTIFYDFFLNSSKIASMTNVEQIGGRVKLKSQATFTPWDNCDDLTGVQNVWENYLYTPTTATSVLSATTEWKSEGTGSLKIAFNAKGNGDLMAAYQSFNSGINWSGYSHMAVDFYCTVAGVLCFFQGKGTSWAPIEVGYLDPSGPNYNILLPLPPSRNSVQGIRLGFYNSSYSGEGVGYMDNIRLLSGTITPYSTGTFTTITKTVDSNIKDIIITDKRIFLTGAGSITLDVSLDGGAHWKTGVSTDLVLETVSGGILATSDGGVLWSNLRNLKLRYNFNRGTDTISPILDDYGIVISRYS